MKYKSLGIIQYCVQPQSQSQDSKSSRFCLCKLLCIFFHTHSRTLTSDFYSFHYWIIFFNGLCSVFIQLSSSPTTCLSHSSPSSPKDNPLAVSVSSTKEQCQAYNNDDWGAGLEASAVVFVLVQPWWLLTLFSLSFDFASLTWATRILMLLSFLLCTAVVLFIMYSWCPVIFCLFEWIPWQ